MADIETSSGNDTTAAAKSQSGIPIPALAAMLLLWRNKAIVVAVIGIVLAIISPANASRYGLSFVFFVIFVLYFDLQAGKKRRHRS